MHQVTYGKKNFLVPECWEECSLELLPIAAAARLSDAPAARVQLAVGMLGGRRAIVRQMKPEDLALLTAWAFDTTPKLEPWLFVDAGETRLYLPAQSFENVTMIEYALADFSFLAYLKSRAAADLITFLSLVVRPAKSADVLKSASWDGDRRETLNTARCKAREAIVSTLTDVQMSAICCLWLEGRSQLAETFQAIFTQGKGNDGGGSLIELIYDIAERGKFGDYDKVCQTPVHTVMLSLFYDKRRAEKK